MRSIWMHPWDLEGEDPGALADRLRGLGLDACSLALKYHGGRVLLPRRDAGRVRELDAGGVYFPPSPERWRGLRLRPRPAPGDEAVPRFLEACAAAGLQAAAWTVVCHDDRLGAEHPDCCVESVFGDRYTHALCPSHPEVREYARALCADVAATPGLARLDVEALGFLGYDHGSLHDKAGIPLTRGARWLLSLCVCSACRARMGAVLEEAATRARAWLEAYFADPAPADPAAGLRGELTGALGDGVLDALLAARREVVASLVEEVRGEMGGLHLNLRLSPDPLFVGGKSALPFDDLPGRADSATITFFGVSPERMAAELHRVPPPEQRPVPVHGGFVFHHPDCASEAGVRHRLGLIRDARLDGVSFYCFGLAAPPHLRWLAAALAADAEPAPPGRGPRLTLHEHDRMRTIV